MKFSKSVVGAILLYIVATGSSFAVFRQSKAVDTVVPPVPGVVEKNGELTIDPAAPRTEACPLNGALYTKEERDIWEKRRPLGIMVENSLEARPHSGVIRADIVYEAVAEGGVTRFMPIHLCDAARSDVVVAPVRSVRSYFIDWISEYGETPLFGHVLGANCSSEVPGGPCKTDPRARALEMLNKIGWRHSKGNDLDQAAIGAPTYKRNEARLFGITGQNVATEHSVEGRTNLLYKIAAERSWTNLDPEGVEWTENFEPWKFIDDATERGTVASVTYDFWSGYKQFDARWDYDATTNEYKRPTGGEPHVDLETQQQLTVKNVIVMFTKELISVDELKHNLYTTTGEGKVLVFQNGQATEGFWKKKDRLVRTRFYTKKGQEIEIVRGKVWISVVGLNTEVDY